MNKSIKKRIIGIVLALGVAIASIVPTFAETLEIDKQNVGSGANPLTIPCDGNKINYVSLGDSVAYGYGMGDGSYKLGFQDIYFGGASKRYAFEVPGCYANLIKNYLEGVSDNNVDYKQRAICSARVEDFLSLIDAKKYPGDDYFNNILVSLMLKGIYSDRVAGSDTDLDKLAQEKLGYTIPTITELNNDFGGAVKEADFITITAGGNNLFAYLVLSPETLRGYGLTDAGDVTPDLSEYYGTSVEASFELIKSTTLAEAKLLDASIKRTDGKTYAAQVKEVFATIEKLFYTLGAYSQSAPKLLDLIHQKNYNAVVAVTGMPSAFADFDIKVGKLTIDLEKIVDPMFGVLNNVWKNAAEARSTYCRYVDISDVELLDPDPEWADRIVEASALEKFISRNLDATHPSAKGHKQIADKIMKNFKLENQANLGRSLGSNGLFNTINNLWTSFLSRIGITRLANLTSVLKSINLSGLLKFSWK